MKQNLSSQWLFLRTLRVERLLPIIFGACAAVEVPRYVRLSAEPQQQAGSLIIRVIADGGTINDGRALLYRVDTRSDTLPTPAPGPVTRYESLRPGRYMLEYWRIGYYPERWRIDIKASCRAVLEIHARVQAVYLAGSPSQPPSPKPVARYDPCAAGA